MVSQTASSVMLLYNLRLLIDFNSVRLDCLNLNRRWTLYAIGANRPRHAYYICIGPFQLCIIFGNQSDTLSTVLERPLDHSPFIALFGVTPPDITLNKTESNMLAFTANTFEVEGAPAPYLLPLDRWKR